MRKLAVLLGLLVVLSLSGAATAAWWIHSYMQRPVDLDREVVFLVPQGAGLRQVSTRLHEAGIISEPEFFHWYSRLLGKATAIRAGEYRIKVGSTPAQLLEQMVAGQVLLHSLTVVEGWTFAQMHAEVRRHPAIQKTADGADAHSLMDALGAPDMHPEGQFFPETYSFPRGTQDVAIFRQAYLMMQEQLRKAWSQREQDLPLASPYEALVLASIVEKETALPKERGLIAGVFVRRLRKGMRLQTDPAVIYGLGPSFDGNLRRRDLESDTPYNTYTRSGLPPTPIALPGKGALLAAVQPEETEALYFVATGDEEGSHYFSATLEEHNRAVRRYLENLRARRKQ